MFYLKIIELKFNNFLFLYGKISNILLRKNGNDWLALDEPASPVPMNPNRRAPIGCSAGPRGPESRAFPSEPEGELTVTILSRSVRRQLRRRMTGWH